MSAVTITSVAISTVSALTAIFSDRWLRRLRGPRETMLTDKVSLEIQEPSGNVISISGEISQENARLLSNIVKNSTTNKEP